MQRQITRGAAAGAGLIFHVFAQDSASTTGAGKASVAYSSWACRYIRNGEAISGAITPEDITTIGTYAAPTAATNIRIKAVDNTNLIGIYEVQIHLDWANSTNSCQSLTIYLTATGVAALPVQIILVAFNPQDAVRLGLTTLPNAAAEAAGGLFTRGSGAGQINQQANGHVDANLERVQNVAQSVTDLKDFADDGYDPSTNKVQGVVLTDTATTLTNAPSDSSGVTTLLSRLSALRAGYLDNLSAGAVALEASVQALITTIGASAAGVASAVWSAAVRLLTAGTNIVLAKGTGVTGFNDLSAAQVNTEADTALSDIGATSTRMGYLDNLSAGAVALASALSSVATNVTSILGKFTGITLLAEWLGLIAGKQTGNSTARTEVRATGAGSGTYDETTDSHEAIRDRGDAAWADSGTPLDAAGVRSAVGLAFANLDTQIGTLATAANLSTANANIATLLTRLSALRAGYLDNLSGGAVALEASLQGLITTVGVAGAGLTAADDAVLAAIAALNNLSQGNVRTAVGLGSPNLDTQLAALSAFIDTEVAAILAKVNNLPADPADASDIAASFASIAATLSGLATQTSVDALPTNAELGTALAAADDAVLAAIAALNNLSAAQVTAAVPTAIQNADALLKRDFSAVTGEATRSALNALRFLRNKWGIAAGTLSVKKEDDSTEAWSGAVTQTAGDPVSAIDPA